MGDKETTPRPPELPASAPDDLKAFVECTGTTLTLRPGPLPWVDGGPTAAYEAGTTPGSINITVGFGFFSLTIPTSVNANGELVADTSRVPDLSDFVEGAGPRMISDWVRKLNDWLRANGKKLGRPTIRRGVVTIPKEVLVAASQEKAMTPAPPAATPAPKLGRNTKIGAATGVTLLALMAGSLMGANSDGPGNSDIYIVDAGAVDIVPAVPVLAPEPQVDVVFHLPHGPVPGHMFFDGPTSFDAPVEFLQEGNQIHLFVPGNDPFFGSIDDQAAFDVGNPDGTFVGSFTGQSFTAKHVFRGQPFDVNGTIERALIREEIRGPEIPVPILADGFKTGDVSAWSETKP